MVVLEAGGYFNEADFNQLELWALSNLYWRGGPTPTADLNLSLQAGSCLGGGTVVNWTNSLRTKDWVREQWAREYGLARRGDRRIRSSPRRRVGAAVGQRSLLGVQPARRRRMKRAAERLGWSFATVFRNWDPDRHDPAMAGYMGFGDQSGAKQSTLRTYLQDAADHGARVPRRLLRSSGDRGGRPGRRRLRDMVGPGRLRAA